MCILASTAGHAQLQVWRHINTSEMANTNIMCMTAGPNGLIYLGTQGGVEVFDGRRFIKMEVPGHDLHRVNPFTHSFCWGRGGLLWVGTRTHILTYNPATAAIRIVYGNTSADALNINAILLDTVRQRVHIIRNDGITTCSVVDTGLTEISRCPLNTLKESAMDEDGDVYVVEEQQRLTRVAGGKATTVFASAYLRDVDRLMGSNCLLMITDAGLVRYNVATGKADTLNIKPQWEHTATKTMVTTLANGQVLIHEPRGIHLLRSISDTFTTFFEPDEKNPAAIQTAFVNYAITDHRGNLWISEDGISLSVLPANAWPIRYISAKMTGAARLWLSYHDTARHQLLCSSEKGLCALYYDSHRASYRPQIRPNETIEYFQPMFYAPWGGDNLLIASNGQRGCWIFNMSTYKGYRFDSINRHTPNINYWAGHCISSDLVMLHSFYASYLYSRSKGTLTTLFTDSAARAFNKTNPGKLELLSSYRDSRKRMWLGGGYGIMLTDSALNVLRIYGQDPARRMDGLRNTVIMSTHEAPDGNIYVATMGGGMYRLTNADTFVAIPLAGNVNNIYCIASIDKDHLCVTTSNGICRYNTATGQSQLLNAGYGMPIADFNQYALSVDRKFVVASGSNGITVIDRDGFGNCFADTANLLVMQGMRSVTSLTLSQGRRSLDFSLTITGYAASANWRVRYRLEGIDDEWHEMNRGEWQIRYNSISPGSYTLRVEATDAQNVVWAAPATVHITALPWFWETAWFRLLMLALGITALVVIVRFFSQLQLKWKLKKLEDEQKITRERLRISRELHDNVGSNLTFLISGLESSGLLLQKGDTGRLEKNITHMRSSARDTMQQLRDSIWALNTESVALTELWRRFGTWLQQMMEAFPGVQYSLSSHMAEDPVLDAGRSLNIFRIMQEAINNVLKHANATHITASCTCSNGVITIVIEDNGIGFGPGQRKGNGSLTMVARAEEAGAEYNLTSERGKGTKIMLTIPLAKG